MNLIKLLDSNEYCPTKKLSVVPDIEPDSFNVSRSRLIWKISLLILEHRVFTVEDLLYCLDTSSTYNTYRTTQNLVRLDDTIR